MLLASRVGRIGVRSEAGVYIVPVAFAFVEGAIFGHSAPGKKMALLRLWPHVGFQVDEVRGVTDWRSVLVQGKWHELTEEADKVHARAVLLRAFDGNLWCATAGLGHRTQLRNTLGLDNHALGGMPPILPVACPVVAAGGRALVAGRSDR